MNTAEEIAVKYPAFDRTTIPAFTRRWPDQTTTQAPIWCSVDLRDGNQALQTPMTVAQKLEFFKLLVRIGFKEIEVGFPASNNTEFSFVRELIEGGHIPEDVTIQVLVQATKKLIVRTAEALKGAKRVIIHLYNSTSPAQREIVFGKSKDEIKDLAVKGTRWVNEYAEKLIKDGTEVVFQYSPESFSATEVGFAIEVCSAVAAVWGASPERKMILNLPDTVEVAGPHIYADQIESFIQNFGFRNSVIISLHTHNDRGTGVAATELGMLAGGERVEGTLFGNGERTGNLDIITVALNLLMHGVHPYLDLSDLSGAEKVYTRCTGMVVPARQPYSGELVFTAFSGSHQDAIKKGLERQAKLEKKAHGMVEWNVPYLTIDPADIGREYAEVIRVNNQSGKAGIAHLLENDCGISLPKAMQVEFSAIASPQIDRMGKEVSGTELYEMFRLEYLEQSEPYSLTEFHSAGGNGWAVDAKVTELLPEGGPRFHELVGLGNGPVDAFVHSLRQAPEIERFEVIHYSEHALGPSSNSRAIAYVCLKFRDEEALWGAGVDTSIDKASVRAILCALNRKTKRDSKA